MEHPRSPKKWRNVNGCWILMAGSGRVAWGGSQSPFLNTAYLIAIVAGGCEHQ
jgi:hypothetical protein